MASWVAVLYNRGIQVPVDGQAVWIQLESPEVLRAGEARLRLVDIGLRLDGSELQLATSSSVCTLQLRDADAAVQLATVLKVLRAEADKGAGVAAWGDRPADVLKRPRAVE